MMLKVIISLEDGFGKWPKYAGILLHLGNSAIGDKLISEDQFSPCKPGFLNFFVMNPLESQVICTDLFSENCN